MINVEKVSIISASNKIGFVMFLKLQLTVRGADGEFFTDPGSSFTLPVPGCNLHIVVGIWLKEIADVDFTRSTVLTDGCLYVPCEPLIAFDDIDLVCFNVSVWIKRWLPVDVSRTTKHCDLYVKRLGRNTNFGFEANRLALFFGHSAGVERGDGSEKFNLGDQVAEYSEGWVAGIVVLVYDGRTARGVAF